MNKQELISKVAEATGLTKKDVGAVVEGFMETVKESLASGSEVNIAGFGKFLVRERAERNGRNPSTGEPLVIAASKAPAFKAGSKLKEAIRG